MSTSHSSYAWSCVYRPFLSSRPARNFDIQLFCVQLRSSFGSGVSCCRLRLLSRRWQALPSDFRSLYRIRSHSEIAIVVVLFSVAICTVLAQCPSTGKRSLSIETILVDVLSIVVICTVVAQCISTGRRSIAFSLWCWLALPVFVRPVKVIAA